MNNQKIKYVKVFGKLMVILSIVCGLLVCWEGEDTYFGLGGDDTVLLSFSSDSEVYDLNIQKLVTTIGGGVSLGVLILIGAELLENQQAQSENIQNLIHSLQSLEEKKYLESKKKNYEDDIEA